MIKADFHVHTSCSDGMLSPSEIVKRAGTNNVSYLAITDHDTVAGITEAIDAGRTYNVTIIPGVELSTQYNDESIHILGYFRDTSYNNEILNEQLKRIKDHRVTRAKQIVQKLHDEYNINIDFENVLKLSKGTVARPHIAKAIINAGYDYSHDYIFENFIGKGCKAYVPTLKLDTQEGISLLKKYNAAVFLAHPKLIKNTHITEFLHMDFDGIESIYFQNSTPETDEFIKIAKDFNLLNSCGSDFHGIENDTRHGDIGCMNIPEEYLSKFLQEVNVLKISK